eukprot:2325321-Heterocapsa_arctica.AAC.1
MDEHGELLRKPRRVVSTMPEIVKLNRLCGHDHPHGLCHGINAKASSYYTPAFAAEVGRMLMEKIGGRNIESGEENVIESGEEN